MRKHFRTVRHRIFIFDKGLKRGETPEQITDDRRGCAQGGAFALPRYASVAARAFWLNVRRGDAWDGTIEAFEAVVRILEEAADDLAEALKSVLE